MAGNIDGVPREALKTHRSASATLGYYQPHTDVLILLRYEPADTVARLVPEKTTNSQVSAGGRGLMVAGAVFVMLDFVGSCRVSGCLTAGL